MREAYLRVVLASLHGEDAETVIKARIIAVLSIRPPRSGGARNRMLAALSARLNWAVE